MSEFERAAIEDYLPLPGKGSQYARDYIEANGAIKLREDGEALWIGLVQGADADGAVSESLRNFHRGRKLHFRKIDKAELAAYLGKEDGETAPAGAEKARAEEAPRIELDRLANDAPIVNLVSSICIDGIRGGASDIHIEALSDAGRVRYRIDGFLRTVRSFDKAKLAAISSRIKVMANLDIMERRMPQDGRMSVDIGGDRVDLRVSIVPAAGGESIALRLFNKSSSPLTLDRLGFAAGQFELVGSMIAKPYGLVLVTGPTGSGKTTTLGAMLRLIASESVKVVSIEDPIEYLIDGVNQIQTNERIRLGFETILRRVLRQDPNVIMVGEIRDSATAELALRAAMTGHLVLSTLHTNDSLSVIPRLRNLGIEPYLIASVLRGAIAQRLVRRVCSDCRRERAATKAEAALLRKYGFGGKKLVSGEGCEACGGSGYRGRVLVSESFAVDRELGEMIARDERSSALAAYLAERGMESLARDGMTKATSGLTSLAEIERELEF
jgi:general secretion pathway protein E/type IV pilus assembly protein PilB